MTMIQRKNIFGWLLITMLFSSLGAKADGENVTLDTESSGKAYLSTTANMSATTSSIAVTINGTNGAEFFVVLKDWSDENTHQDIASVTATVYVSGDNAQVRTRAVDAPAVVDVVNGVAQTASEANGYNSYNIYKVTLPASLSSLTSPTIEVHVELQNKVDLSTTLTDNDITFGSLTYNGSEQHTSVTVAGLTENQHYEVGWPAASTDAGSGYTATITGKAGSHYYGSKQKTYSIGQKALTITATAQSVVYGTAITQGTEMVSTVGLVEGDALTGITLTQSITNVGTGTITPSGATTTKGASNYDITYATGTLTISTKAVTVSGITASNKTYDGNTTATLDCSGATITGKVDSDELTVTATGTFEDASVGTEKTVSISGLTVGGTSAGNYTLAESGLQETATAAITAKDLTITAKGQAITYDNSIAEDVSQVNVTGLVDGDALTGITLTPSITDAGTGTIMPSAAATTNGVGNYSVTYNTGVLTINPKALNSDMITLSPTGGIWTGNEQGFPTVTVSDSGNPTTDDYTYQWAKQGDATLLTKFTDRGTYVVTVTGQRNYTGSVQKEFSVGSQSIEGAVITFSSPSAVFMEDASHVVTDQTPGFTVTKDGNNLTDGTHYETARWQKNVDGSWVTLATGETVALPGVYRVVIAGKDDYVGEATSGEFQILKCDITDANVTAVEDGESTKTYDGAEHHPAVVVTVTHGTTAVTLREGIDYTIVSSDDYTAATTYKVAGEYSFGISAMGSYQGGGNATFTIAPRNYDLTFTGTGKWATFYNEEQVRLKRGDAASGLTAYFVGGVSEESVTAEPISGDVIPAKMPVLLNRGTSTATSFECEIVGDDATGSEAGLPDFVGVNTATSISRGSYILIKDVFVRSDAGSLAASRCYLTGLGGSGARMRTIIVDNGDGTTTIDAMGIESESDATDQWYSMDGQRIGKPQQKGIYIKNNKKVVIK